jgi:hypothetical protein
MASRCSTNCAPPASLVFPHLLCGVLAKKTAPVECVGQAQRPGSLQALAAVQPGHDVDTEGEGDILRVTGLPQPGKRTVTVDTDESDPRKKLIVDEHMDVYPRTYTIEQYGYHPNEVALLRRRPRPQVDPEDSRHPQEKNVKGTFMLIGAEAAENTSAS